MLAKIDKKPLSKLIIAAFLPQIYKLVEQESIRRIFLSRGITGQPVFDEYIDQYDWDA